jgi:type IV fimbrial biogenesis protein FimT
MVTVAVIGVLAVVAVPAMTSLVNANRLNGAAGELQVAVQLARSEAVRRNVPVTVCASSDGTTCNGATAWTRWIVRGRDPGTVSTIDIMRDETPAGGVELTGPVTGVVYRPSGLIDSAQQVEVDMAGNQRYVCMQVSGLATISKVACP